MKKIFCYIDMMQRGGAQRVMCNLVHYFSEKGYEVVLCNDFESLKDAVQYEVSSNIKRVYLTEAAKENPLVKNIKRIVRLRKLIKEEKPDIVLSFLGNPNKRMLISTFGLKTKKIVSVRNDPHREYGSSCFQRWIAQFLFRLADGVVFQTEEAKQYFCKSVRDHSCVIMNPVDARFFSARRSGPEKSIVTLGRLAKQKNQKLLIEAFSRVAEDFPEETLTIYGEGDLQSELSEFASGLDIGHKVFFPGNTDDVLGVLVEAKLFVLSSDYEGMPNALLEAMAVGVPCISTDCPCGGPRELIIDGENGYLVPCGDVQELTKKMRLCLKDKALRNLLGNNAKETAEGFRGERVYQRWEQYFLHILRQ